jgi:hypothetical protein
MINASLKSLLIALIFSLSQLAAAKTQFGVNSAELETIEWAYEKAQRFSGISSLDPANNWKKIAYYILTDEELSKQVCPNDPHNCHGLAAVFETVTNTIYIREDVHPDLSIVNLSFLIHEMVHALQSETRSEDELFGDCAKLYQTEKQAYDAQDAFLKAEGQFFRAGTALRFFNCN